MCEAESAILVYIPYSAPNSGECRKPREGISESLHGKSAEENPKCGIFEKPYVNGTAKGIEELLRACIDFILQKAQRSKKLGGNSNP